MQGAQRGKEGKASKQPGNFTEYPTRRAGQGGERKFIFDLRKAAGQSAGRLAERCWTPDGRSTFAWKISPAKDGRRRETKEYCLYKRTGRRRGMKRVKRQKEDRKGKAQAGYKGPENTARDAEDG